MLRNHGWLSRASQQEKPVQYSRNSKIRPPGLVASWTRMLSDDSITVDWSYKDLLRFFHDICSWVRRLFQGWGQLNKEVDGLSDCLSLAVFWDALLDCDQMVCFTLMHVVCQAHCNHWTCHPHFPYAIIPTTWHATANWQLVRLRATLLNTLQYIVFDQAKKGRLKKTEKALERIGSKKKLTHSMTFSWSQTLTLTRVQDSASKGPYKIGTIIHYYRGACWPILVSLTLALAPKTSGCTNPNKP